MPAHDTSNIQIPITNDQTGRWYMERGDVILLPFFPPIPRCQLADVPDSLRSPIHFVHTGFATCGVFDLERAEARWPAAVCGDGAQVPSGDSCRANPFSILPPVQAWGKLLGREKAGRHAVMSEGRAQLPIDTSWRGSSGG